MASQDDGPGGWGSEDGNSLFEGMVLFAPEPVAAEEPALSPVPKPLAARPDADAASSQTSAASPPLDEDLFSDLTLLAPPEPSPLEQQPPLGEDRAFSAPTAAALSSPASAPSSPTPAPSAPAAALSRQPSSSSLRKKKRAVRIGYGRSPQPAPPAPLPSAAIPATAAVATISASSSTLTDASPHTAAPHTPDQYPVEQVDVYGHGDEQSTMALDPVDNSVRVEEDAKEEDGEKENGAGGVAEVGIQERLAILRSQISGKLESIQQRSATVVAKRRQLAARRRKVAEDVSSATSKHKDLERELEEACETEDFERAERISDSIAALEKEKDQLLMALRDAEVDYDSVDSELQDVLESRIAAEEEAAVLLEQFAKLGI
ncbi:hypothetical protein PR202_gb02675 [Eleusine coracana subsp. coracana]|uniref:UVR domain-containing protein n=1 Tax=Eleusine coracana subsp. coracana TaxID=191504 RepID=A0AAV5DZ71_ELECO|nr:hypothetical protein PR202_gb02675 [Eleusine coracana subsp. coracana]